MNNPVRKKGRIICCGTVLIDCIVTRDPAHFKNSPVAVHDPESFAKWLKR